MRRLHFRAAALAALWVLGGPMASAAAPDYSAVREQFLRAMAQVAPSDDTNDDPALRSYPLYPYLQAERIVQALSGAPTALAADRRFRQLDCPHPHRGAGENFGDRRHGTNRVAVHDGSVRRSPRTREGGFGCECVCVD